MSLQEHLHIGYSASKIFIQNGCRVFGSVRKISDGDKLIAELGSNFIPINFDVTDHKAIEREALIVKETIGSEGLACLINNAGRGSRTSDVLKHG